MEGAREGAVSGWEGGEEVTELSLGRGLTWEFTPGPEWEVLPVAFPMTVKALRKLMASLPKDCEVRPSRDVWGLYCLQVRVTP